MSRSVHSHCQKGMCFIYMQKKTITFLTCAFELSSDTETSAVIPFPSELSVICKKAIDIPSLVCIALTVSHKLYLDNIN